MKKIQILLIIGTVFLADITVVSAINITELKSKK